MSYHPKAATKRERWIRSCAGKEKHKTKAAAEHEVRRLWRKNRDRVYSYFCPLCYTYHTGHRNGDEHRDRRKISRRMKFRLKKEYSQ